MYLYIDANVYLDFYGFTKDALDELEKLLKLVQSKDVVLLLPDQTRDEVNRLRERNIRDVISAISDSKYRTTFPAVMSHYEEVTELKSVARKYNVTFEKMLAKFKHDVTNRTLRADKLVQALHADSTRIPSTKKMVRLASVRKTIGNPPGKGNSHGDQLNWECLINFNFRDGSIFSIVSDDTDYYSPLYDDEVDRFLQDEFLDIHPRVSLIGHKLLSRFIKANFPNIQFDESFPKSLLLSKLRSANSYASAKSCLYKLENLQPFSYEEIKDIAVIMSSNSQLYDIPNDGVIRRFAFDILYPNKDLLPKEIRDSLAVHYKR